MSTPTETSTQRQSTNRADRILARIGGGRKVVLWLTNWLVLFGLFAFIDGGGGIAFFTPLKQNLLLSGLLATVVTIPALVTLALYDYGMERDRGEHGMKQGQGKGQGPREG